MTEEDPDLLAGDNLDRLRGREPYSPMSERFRLTELLETAKYQNNLLVQKCRELEKERDEARREVEAKEKINATLTSSFDAIRRERDEARWEVCGFHHLTGFLAGDYAISRGWNYFNDERKWAKFPPSVKDFKEFLKAHSDENRKSIERLHEENRQLREALGIEREKLAACCIDRKAMQQERDEARREVLNSMHPDLRKSHAAARGWDCFKENTDE